jgi:hypothetical protein
VDQIASVAAIQTAAAPSESLEHSRAGSWVARLPHPQAFIATVFVGFAAATLLVARLFGLSFVAPTESVSQAIGVHYLVPFAIGAIGYAIVQLVLKLSGSNLPSIESWPRGVASDCFYLVLFIFVIYLHFHIKMWMPVINPNLHDIQYLAIDQWFGGLLDIFRIVRGAVASIVPAVDAWYQLGFLAMFALSLWFHAAGHRRWHHHNMVALLLVEMAGAFSYLIAPAVGPFIFEQGRNALATTAQHSMLAGFKEVQASGAAWLAIHGGSYFTGPPAAMPSLHIAGAVIMAYYSMKARLLVAPVMLILLGWIGIESVVARWHYIVDLPAGVALAVAVIIATNRVCRPRPTAQTSAA